MNVRNPKTVTPTSKGFAKSWGFTPMKKSRREDWSQKPSRRDDGREFTGFAARPLGGNRYC